MSKLFDKIKDVEAEIAHEVGGLVLFGLFKPAETPYWHVPVSADWVGPTRAPTIVYVAEKLQDRLDSEQLLQLSRIVPLLPSEEFVQSVAEEIRTEDVGRRLYHRVFNGLLFDEVYIVALNPGSKPHAAFPHGHGERPGHAPGQTARRRKEAKQANGVTEDLSAQPGQPDLTTPPRRPSRGDWTAAHSRVHESRNAPVMVAP